MMVETGSDFEQQILEDRALRTTSDVVNHGGSETEMIDDVSMIK